MGLFVRVQYSETERGVDLVLIYEVRKLASKPSLVSDYALCEYASGKEISRITAYPRCVESGLTLFARLLKSASGYALSRPAVGRIAVSLRIGDEPMRAVERELLQLSIEDTSFIVDLLSPAGLVAGRRVAAQPAPSILCAICEGMRNALGWSGIDRHPPQPLSAIPVRRTASGGEYVYLSDVPPLPRQYLLLHLCPSMEDQTIQASVWRALLGRCADSTDDANPAE